MNDELKTKLTAIIDKAVPFYDDGRPYADERRNYFIGATVDQIDQAYQEEGYVRLDSPEAKEYYRIVFENEGIEPLELPFKFMSGPQFYEQFKKELHLVTEPKSKDGLYGMMLEAAKRAAGLE